MRRMEMIQDLETLKAFFEEQSDAYPVSLAYAIEELSKPERKKGKNIFMQGKGHCEFKCSLCGVEIGVVEGGALDGGYFKFCPNCGADMRGGGVDGEGAS